VCVASHPRTLRLIVTWLAVALLLAGCRSESGPSEVGAGGYGGQPEVGGAGGSPAGTVSSIGSGGAMPCDSLGDCGNFGRGCVNCAVTTACRDVYEGCFYSTSCVQYAVCVEMCTADDLACVDSCRTAYPGADQTYDALVLCVLCDECSISCQTSPTVCH
jgi:hypothetical protein